MDFYPLNRKPEQIAQESTMRPGLFKDIAKGAGILLVSVALLTSFSIQDEEISRFESRTKTIPEPNGDFNIISANVRYNALFASDLMEEHGAEIGVFQETQKDSIQDLVDDIAGSTAIFAPSDYAVDWEEGGLGNTTASVGPNTTDSMRQIKGGLDIFGLFQGLIGRDKSAIANSYKERRTALLSSFRAEIDGVKVPLNAMNVHVGGGKLGKEQLDDVMEFADDRMNSQSVVNIIFGDFNRTPREVKAVLNETECDWIISEIGPTSRNDDRQIDHVIYKPFVKIGKKTFIVVVKPQLLQKKGSDHRAINTTIHLQEIPSTIWLEELLQREEK